MSRFTLRELESLSKNKDRSLLGIQVKEIKRYLKSDEAKERRKRGLKAKITRSRNKNIFDSKFKMPSLKDLIGN